MNRVHSKTDSLFSTLTTQIPYNIPYSQRPYKWKMSNWESVWDSLFVESEKTSFFGTIILLSERGDRNRNLHSSSSSGNGNGFQIFDGQQRITTFSILIKAFMEVVYDEGEHQRSGIILATYLKLTTGKPRLNANDKIKDFFDANILSNAGNKPSTGTSVDEKNICKAFNYFYDKCKNEIDDVHQGNTIEFADRFDEILNDIEVVTLTINDFILGIEIFESVNATGEKLDASELVKNILIKYSDILNYENIHQDWDVISNKSLEAGFRSIVEILHYYWIARYNYIGKTKLFQSMKETFGADRDKWMNFFKDFKKTVDTIHELFTKVTYDDFILRYPKASTNPGISYRYIDALKSLLRVKNKSWVLPIFTILNYELSINESNESFINNNFHKLVESHFMFCFLHFNIYSLPANEFFASMYNLSQNINKYHIEFPNPSNSKPKIKKLIKDHFKLSGEGYVYKSVLKFRSFKDEFVEGVAKLKYSTKDNFLLKIIFNDINMKVFGGQKLDYNRTTFEHYLPQNPSEWEINRDIAANHCHKIGNLLFIDKDLNSHLQNFKHKIKLKALKDNPNLTNAFTKEFIKVHDLGNPEFDFNKIDENHLKNSDFDNNPSEIDKRTKSIANCLWNIYINDFNYKVY